ncbi:transposase family protein [Glutamicibacter sp. JC586]|uniref:integrase catalytic domain-containing protein n=1 Tax=Glutamicibacter sp. JC586 TaxID=2590552 RepID=UPI001F45507A|nr:transposase family protein [Glutamicibacter sp. JC586]
MCLRTPAPSYAYIHRRISDIAFDRGLHAPGYTTIRSVARNIDPGLLALAAGGNREYRDKFELVYRRTTQAPNEQWQMDHTLLDVMILDEQQRPIRPWLSIVLDDYSRAIVGYSLNAKAPSAQQSALALHHAISRKDNPLWPIYGLPNVLYTDHGTDFTSSRIDELCLALHIQLIHS